MTYRAEVLDSDEIASELGELKTATEARAASAQHENDTKGRKQPWEGM